MNRNPARVAFFAGTRGEVLRLAPLFHALRAEGPRFEERPIFVAAGEQGTCLHQALDFMALRPDLEFEMRNPSEDSSLRLIGMLEEIESVCRNRRITHAVLGGFGATAAAGALVSHSRPNSALWFRPCDPTGLNARQRWEGGLEHLIRSLAPAVTVHEGSEIPAPPAPVVHAKIEGRRPGARLVVISMTRRIWGMSGVSGRLSGWTAQWARQHPEMDWLLLSPLDARIDEAWRSVKERPANLLWSPPLPYPQYAALMRDAHGLLADSPHTAAEGIAWNLRVAALGELPAPPEQRPNLKHILPPDLSTPETAQWLAADQAPKSPSPLLTNPDSAFTTLLQWLGADPSQ